MTGFHDRGAHRHSRHYVEHADRVKASQGVPLDGRSSGLVQYPGYSQRMSVYITPAIYNGPKISLLYFASHSGR